MIGHDDAGEAAQARYAYTIGWGWRERYLVGAFAWRVYPPHRERYNDVHALSLVKGFEGEVADDTLEL